MLFFVCAISLFYPGYRLGRMNLTLLWMRVGWRSSFSVLFSTCFTSFINSSSAPSHGYIYAKERYCLLYIFSFSFGYVYDMTLLRSMTAK